MARVGLSKSSVPITLGIEILSLAVWALAMCIQKRQTFCIRLSIVYISVHNTRSKEIHLRTLCWPLLLYIQGLWCEYWKSTQCSIRPTVLYDPIRVQGGPAVLGRLRHCTLEPYLAVTGRAFRPWPFELPSLYWYCIWGFAAGTFIFNLFGAPNISFEYWNVGARESHLLSLP